MKRKGFRNILIILLSSICLLTFAMPVHAAEDWKPVDVPGYADMKTTVIGFTTDLESNVYMVYSISDPTGGIMPFPMAMKYDGSTWKELGSGFIAEANVGQCILRYDEMTGRLYMGMLTINGLIHIYAFEDDEWTELPYTGRLIRIDPQFMYYDFQLMPDGAPMVAYVDSEEDGRITAKVYRNDHWTILGESGFTEETASYISLAVDDSKDIVYAGMIIQRSVVEVWKFTADTGWEATDTSMIEAGYPYWTKMAMGNQNRPILVYMDTDQEWKAFGLIYDEGTWTTMEPYPFSPMLGTMFIMATDSNGWPIVFFNDYEYEKKISSMRYDGTKWEYHGSRGFSPQEIYTVFAGIDKEDVPFILLPEMSKEGHILKMEIGEVEAGVGVSEAEKPDESVDETTSEPETGQPVEEPELESESGLSSVILIFGGALVVLIVIFFVFKRNKKDEEEMK